MKLRYCFPILLLFSGCHYSDPWINSSIRNASLRNDMAKLVHRPSSPNSGILFELVRHCDDIEAYVSVYTLTIPCYRNNPSKAELMCRAGNNTFRFIVDRLQGGQRLHLSKTAWATLLFLFTRHDEIWIGTGHYSQKLQVKLFEKHYKRLCRRPLRCMPEKIVTFEIY